MNNEEGARGAAFESPSRDPFDEESESEPHSIQKFEGRDISPVSSQYSSCGESEYERYCSANSLMGTPSLCSSVGTFHECAESDFGSLNSLGIRESDGLEGFSLGGRFIRKFENVERSLSNGSGNWVSQEYVNGEGEAGISVDDGERFAKFEGGQHIDNSMECSCSEVNHDAVVEESFDGSHFMHELDRLVHSTGQDDASSVYEHSEGDDSMFNYGSDNEQRSDANNTHNLYDGGLVEADSGNFVLMNTSVAFGSNDWDDFEPEGIETIQTSSVLPEPQGSREEKSETEIHRQDSNSLRSAYCARLDGQKQGDIEVNDGPVECPLNSSATLSGSLHSRVTIDRDEANSSLTCSQIQDDDETDEYLASCSISNVFSKQESLMQPALHDIGPVEAVTEKVLPCVSANEASGHNNQQALEGEPVRIMERRLYSLSDTMPSTATVSTKDVFEDFPTKDVIEDKAVQFDEGHTVNTFSSGTKSSNLRATHGLNMSEDISVPHKGKSLELNAFYDEVVHEMEEILLDSSGSHVSRLNQGNLMFHSQQSLPVRDGGLTASTSGLDDGVSLIQQSLRVDSIEVVGAKQKKGDISLSERLVGVKEYTVYVIRVWSGNNQWEVERRYRDFYTLYRQLKYSFANQGWILPAPWLCVERESRKIFGNVSPDVIAERSVLIQECLRSVLQLTSSSCAMSSLVWFLSPQKALPRSPLSSAQVRQSTAADREDIPTFGKTISLVLELRAHKPVKQLLEAQHYECAGCHKHFDDGRSRVRGFVQTFGWAKPRFCEYTGQLFCSSCHSNDTAVLPARVLHNWDFTEYPVSQLAKSYLDSIVNQPMLCVSAVNPFLFSKVPALLCVVGIRKKIGAMIAYVHCPFRRTIYRGLQSRRYLLESNDFFALRDLIDLSKGAFAALPVILENVLNRIREHITEQCLLCCDCGVPCGARQVCDDPSSLIFPFQEEDVDRCESCNSVFHEHCFKKLTECHCGAHLKLEDANQSTSKQLSLLSADGDAAASLPLLQKRSEVTASEGLLSRFFSVTRRDRTKQFDTSDNVIPMGSFPAHSY